MLVKEAYVFVNLQGEDVVAGKVQHHRENRGLERFYFVYGQSYLKRTNAFSLDPRQLPLSTRTFILNALPLAIQDSGPDEFGRMLYARTIGEASSPLDYHIANGPFGVGALALSESLQLEERSLLVKFDALDDIAKALKMLAASKPLPERLENLLHPGSSLPGARPKALLIDDEGDQWIAKFGRDNDIFDIQIAEAAAMSAAQTCGIRVAEHRLEKIRGQTVYLTKRFDREQKIRHHFLSAYTLMGGANANTENYYQTYAYPRLAELTHRVSREPQEDCRELFKRMVFNALCANKDDHLKNHGFLMGIKNTYRLSPAYDIVPGAGAGDHAIGLGGQGAQATRENLLSKCAAFKLGKQEAEKIMHDIKPAVTQIVERAKNLGMKEGELAVLKARLEKVEAS
ncbi:type II toxin-antitoxin system HipA family toxin [Teredinibacter franksiae]|jgi:Uncharacterized protein related to capsule biosynthesis enzymes|uniref:type II toxin-antitoxin system HipA family toxin n=1 Tax=Teredinibacter franksiae TaxID=2761453 RepID=UPI00162A6277|nr:HipA domain-containing protein [Teredinibacter franksiae]